MVLFFYSLSQSSENTIHYTIAIHPQVATNQKADKKVETLNC